MDKEHIKGAADKAKGAVKDTVGKMTGDTKMQAEGKVDKAKGTAHNVAGDLKITTKNLTSKGRLRSGLFVADEATRRQLQNLGQRPTCPGVASALGMRPG